jgi:hypothetical protein
MKTDLQGVSFPAVKLWHFSVPLVLPGFWPEL